MRVELFRAHKARRTAREIVKQSRHLRNMRGDLLAAEDRDGLFRGERQVCRELHAGNTPEIEKAGEDLYKKVVHLTPRRNWPRLRENLEILVVAVAVAMAVRTYFVQPFKIPTGSMQPTLYGIHSWAQAGPSFFDKMPMRIVKWLFFGTAYEEVVAKASGYLRGPLPAEKTRPGYEYYYVSGVPHLVPKGAEVTQPEDAYVSEGDLLWRGVVKKGDHVFVNKVSWNFRRPRRGEIIVFRTDGIPTLPPGTHYIKRLVGLPSETVEIRPPNVVVDGKVVTGPQAIARISGSADGYAGYHLASGLGAAFLKYLGDAMKISAKGYLALGDNTLNSRDSRYWGEVPERNMVGPAVFVYWPLSKRWGLTE